MDNLFIFNPKDSKIPAELAKELKNKFQFIHLELINYFLNIKVNKNFVKKHMHFN